MSAQLQLQIDNSNASMNNSFGDYYKNMVNYFRQNSDENLD
ncbi:hypothetical protein QO189_09610 [Psychrobacter sp. Arc29]